MACSGGGNEENTDMDRARPPLRWMVFEAQAVGLRTLPFKRELREVKKEEQISGKTVTKSMTWSWLFFEICPFKRLTFTREENGSETTRMCVCFSCWPCTH